MGKVLTDKFVAGIRGDGTTQTFTDAGQKGLNIRVGADGTVKTWSVQFRRKSDGKTRRVDLGRYPAVTHRQARQPAAEIMVEVAKGKDPTDVKAAAKAAPVQTIADLVADHMQRAASEHRARKEKQRRFDVYVLLTLGALRYAELSRKHASRLLDTLKVPRTEERTDKKGKTRTVRVGGPAMANRVYDDLRALASWGVSTGYFEADPLAALARPAPTRKRKRALSAVEVGKAARGVRSAPGMTDAVRRILRLLIGSNGPTCHGTRASSRSRPSASSNATTPRNRASSSFP